MFIQPIQDFQAASKTFIHLGPTGMEVVKKIAIHCFKELALSMTLGAAVALFIPISAGVTTLACAMFIQSIVGLFFHSLGGFAAYKAAQRGPNQAAFEKMVSVCEWWTGENFAFLTGLNAQLLIHETGHSLATYAVYKNPRPSIDIMPFEGGLTKYYKIPVGVFGKKIGPVATTILVVSSGPGFTLLFSSALLTLGMAMREKYPQVSKYLMSWGILDFLNHANYAFSALKADPSNLKHDFVHLSILGLNPVVAGIGILAIPIVIAFGMYLQKNPQPIRLPVIESVFPLIEKGPVKTGPC